VTRSEQKFHQTGFKGKWYYQSIRHKTEIRKVEKFSVWNGKFCTEYSEKKKKIPVCKFLLPTLVPSIEKDMPAYA